MRVKVVNAAMWTQARDFIALLASIGLVWGCSGGGETGTAPVAARNPASAAPKVTQPADAVSRYMVSAVPADKTASAHVQVKFELKGRPQLDQPVDVDIVILPLSGSLDRVAGKVTAEEGLELVGGGEIPAADRPAERVPIPHTVQIRPKRDGIFTLGVVLTVDSAGQSATETYSMPVIAGAGLPDSSAPAAGAPVAEATAGRTPPPAAAH